jgi:hypothetical protein
MQLQSHWYIAGDPVSHSRRSDCWTARCENMKSCTAVEFSICIVFYIESKLNVHLKMSPIWRLLTSNADVREIILLLLLLLSVTASLCFPLSWHATLFVVWLFSDVLSKRREPFNTVTHGHIWKGRCPQSHSIQNLNWTLMWLQMYVLDVAQWE